MIKIIPAIDLIEGRCVRLSQGDYGSKKIYDCEPSETARRFEDCGLGQIHVVDLDGAKASEPKNLRVLEKIASTTSLLIEWGGGLKTADSLQSCFDAGASMAICGSVAVDRPELFKEWLLAFGPYKIVLGADVRGSRVATHGWLQDSMTEIDELTSSFIPDGLSRIICTDISRDGMLQGPNFELYTTLAQQFASLEITVSGGVSSLSDIEKADALGLKSIITGKALYEGKITLKELKRWLQNA